MKLIHTFEYYFDEVENFKFNIPKEVKLFDLNKIMIDVKANDKLIRNKFYFNYFRDDIKGNTFNIALITNKDKVDMRFSNKLVVEFYY